MQKTETPLEKTPKLTELATLLVAGANKPQRKLATGMKTLQTYSVRPDWRKRAIRVCADGPFWALNRAAETDHRLIPFTFSCGMSSQEFPWGMRYERAQVCVDVVRIAKH